MKKLIMCTLLVVGLVACKKENATENNTTNDSANSTEKVENTTAKPTANLIEINVEKANDLLATQQNDTLYVTNFFATWCGPCMKEIPHFKEKMTELKGKLVKFTFISIDDKNDWNDKVKSFAEENELTKNVVLMDGSLLNPEFFQKNFKTWQGESIPFTFMKKGNKSDETVGSMSKEDLDKKIASFIQ